jgi:hypothetical protein
MPREKMGLIALYTVLFFESGGTRPAVSEKTTALLPSIIVTKYPEKKEQKYKILRWLKEQRNCLKTTTASKCTYYIICGRSYEKKRERE